MLLSRWMTWWGEWALALALIAADSALARNVDLSTVPKRNTVQLTIYNSEDLTLVRETRTVTFRKGVNPLQFSWANTLIDPTSVELKFLTSADKLDVLDTTFPHDKPQMLYWNVQSEMDGEATIQITYFTSGITWKADYTLIADKDDKAVGFEGFVRVFNNSGEEYDNAQVRLVVGTINLVEKIARLARVSVTEFRAIDGRVRGELRHRAFEDAVDVNGEIGGPGGGGGFAYKPKQIIKEGLSEYFIYTIEGTETIPNGWSKRLRSIEPATVPLKIQYRYRPAEYGDQLVRMYLLTNDKESKLGTTPLPDGTVRVFRHNGHGGLSFLAAQSVKYIPIGDKIELNLGPDPNVIFELIKLRAVRDDIWMRIGNADVFRQIGGAVQIEVNSSVVGWDDHEVYTQRIRNYTAKPIDLEIRRAFPGHVVFRSQLKPLLHDYQTVQFTAAAEPAKKTDLLFEVLPPSGPQQQADQRDDGTGYHHALSFSVRRGNGLELHGVEIVQFALIDQVIVAQAAAEQLAAGDPNQASAIPLRPLPVRQRDLPARRQVFQLMLVVVAALARRVGLSSRKPAFAASIANRWVSGRCPSPGADPVSGDPSASTRRAGAGGSRLRDTPRRN